MTRIVFKTSFFPPFSPNILFLLSAVSSIITDARYYRTNAVMGYGLAIDSALLLTSDVSFSSEEQRILKARLNCTSASGDDD